MGGPIACLVVPLLFFVYPKMITVIVMLLWQGLFVITFCIISADQFGKAHAFMNIYIYTCVKDNNGPIKINNSTIWSSSNNSDSNNYYDKILNAKLWFNCMLIIIY